MCWLRVLFRPSLSPSHPAQHAYQILKHREGSSNYKEYWNIRFCSAVVEIDTSNHNHAHRDDHGDAAGDGAADSTEKQEDNFDYEVDHIS